MVSLVYIEYCIAKVNEFTRFWEVNAMESIDVLKKNLELAKEQLKIVDNDIKRITGRDPSDRRIGEANSKRIRARIAGVNQLRFVLRFVV